MICTTFDFVPCHSRSTRLDRSSLLILLEPKCFHVLNQMKYCTSHLLTSYIQFGIWKVQRLIKALVPRGGTRNFPMGAESSDEGAKIWFSGYYKCQKSPTKSLFTFRQVD